MEHEEDVKVEVIPALAAYAAMNQTDLVDACRLDTAGTPKAHLAYLKRLVEVRNNLIDMVECSEGPDWLLDLAQAAHTRAVLNVDFYLLQHPELGRPSSEVADVLEKHVFPEVRKKMVDAVEDVDLDF
jgi:hypothetical protein